MNIELIKRVPHQRQRTGVKSTKSGTYVRFEYQCKPDCVRCALDKAEAMHDRVITGNNNNE